MRRVFLAPLAPLAPLAIGALLASSAAPAAQVIDGPPPPPITWEQKLGAELPLDARFVDHEGRALTLGDCFTGRPVVLALVYYECPMLCGLVLEGLVSSLKALDFEPGREFDIVVLSIDPDEGPALAASKRANTLVRCGIDEHDPRASGWRFLTGAEPDIRAVAAAVGFGYRYVPEQDQWAHAAGITVVTGAGRVSRVLFGVEFAPRDLRFSLVEAAAGTIGTPLDQVLLLCFHYDPSRGKYGFAVLAVLRFFGIGTVLVLAGCIAGWIRRERRALAAARS